MELVQSSFNNSSFISSSSSRKKQRHEIFISFRGETRNSFVSHLQYALENKQAIIFSDKTSLHSGQIIANELHKAIKNASIALVVFSKYYASSTWCLKELVWILEHKNNGGLIVMPIFYDVDPSDVRKQKNSFAKSFEEHEAGGFKDLPETILTWKNALKEVTSLVGEDIRGQNEASCVKKIVNDVLSRLPSTNLYTADLFGIESRIRNLKIEINSRNNNNSNELVSWLGIYGETGIGKTTTATSLFHQIKRGFDSKFFLLNAKEINSKMNSFRKQAKLDEAFIIDEESDSNLVMSVDEIDHQKLLLVVDDVDEIEQVDQLVSESKWFGAGSTIIITTKNHDLLNRFDRVHKIDALHVDDSRKLFDKYAFKYCNTQSHHHEDCMKYSLEVVEYSTGHPLLLKVLGSHFGYLQKEKNVQELKNSLEKLENLWLASRTNSIESVISKLEISFNGLSVSQKKVMIDLACFLTRGTNTSEDDLNMADYYSADFKVLIEKSLIYVKNEGEVLMHDLIREMCSNIEQERVQNEVRRYKQLWGRKDAIEELLTTNGLSYWIEARKLSIKWSENPEHWRWTSLPNYK